MALKVGVAARGTNHLCKVFETVGAICKGTPLLHFYKTKESESLYKILKDFARFLKIQKDSVFELWLTLRDYENIGLETHQW